MRCRPNPRFCGGVHGEWGSSSLLHMHNAHVGPPLSSQTQKHVAVPSVGRVSAHRIALNALDVGSLVMAAGPSVITRRSADPVGRPLRRGLIPREMEPVPVRLPVAVIMGGGGIFAFWLPQATAKRELWRQNSGLCGPS